MNPIVMRPGSWTADPIQTVTAATMFCVPSAAKSWLTVDAAGKLTASNAVNYQKETIDGNGATYKGLQSKTKTGIVCQKWSVISPNPHAYTQCPAGQKVAAILRFLEAVN